MTGPTDPLSALDALAGHGPADPDPTFAERLRDRLRDAVLTPRAPP